MSHGFVPGFCWEKSLHWIWSFFAGTKCCVKKSEIIHEFRFFFLSFTSKIHTFGHIDNVIYNDNNKRDFVPKKVILRVKMRFSKHISCSFTDFNHFFLLFFAFMWSDLFISAYFFEKIKYFSIQLEKTTTSSVAVKNIFRYFKFQTVKLYCRRIALICSEYVRAVQIANTSRT